MFEIDIDGKKCEAAVTFYTAQLYENEFQSDMLKDFLGVQVLESEESKEGDKVVKLDFTKTNWLATAKVLWAALKTADEKTPGYTRWMKATTGVNMWLVKDELALEVADCFFRTDAAGEEVEGEG